MGPVDRRSFLGGAAAIAAAVGTGCRPVAVAFPQGVGSGDPRPDGVLLWTRAEAEDTVEVEWQVSESESFEALVGEGAVSAGPETDFTVRVAVDGLRPATTYHYRFVVGSSVSPIGRTRTAPAPDDDRPVRIAVANCQDYIGRWYHAWRALLEEDDVDLVVFLGDYIYETVADPRHQTPTAERSITLPDGLPLSEEPENVSAISLADYRALYRAIRSDPDLQEVHRRFPFVVIWDDHEHANDAWQDVTNEFDGARGEERDTARREAATQAWVEYLPVDVPFDPEEAFPNDVKTWRELRYGANVHFFCLDCRYYRDDHLVPEDEIEPLVGKLSAPSPMGSRILAQKEGFDTLEAARPPTMLGTEQKAWLTEGILESTARYKVVVSPLMVAQMVLDLTAVEGLSPLLSGVWYFKLDQWDGYRTERREILESVAEVPGVVVLSGDLHGSYAAELRPDFDTPGPTTAVELTFTGISSIPLQTQLDEFIELDPLLAALDLGPVVGQFDAILQASSPHFRHADASTYGFGIVSVDGNGFAAEMIDTSDAEIAEYGGVVRRTRFVVGPEGQLTLG